MTQGRDVIWCDACDREIASGTGFLIKNRGKDQITRHACNEDCLLQISEGLVEG